ncbi:MAG: LPS export ABC transporter periplasmic protein LptC, partial [Candidatus Eiseniibacteriota bacterium]
MAVSRRYASLAALAVFVACSAGVDARAFAQAPPADSLPAPSTRADSMRADSVRADSARARADTTHADSTAAPPAPPARSAPIFGPPPEGAPPPPLRTRSRRGGPYNVVADRLEGGRSATEGETISLIGNVTLSREGTVVKSQLGRYVKKEGAIYLTGGVTAIDGKTTITSREAVYNEATDFLSLSGDVVVRDGDLILNGDFGSYDQTTGRAELWSRVRGREGSRTMRADRLTYLRDDEIAQARGNVTARDSAEALTLTAGAVDYDRRREMARATNSPRLVQDPTEGKGATTLEGDTITVFTKDRLASALGHVRIERDSLRAEAGRAFFDDNAQRGLLLDSPRAWNDEVSVTGDSLEVYTRDRALERLRVRSGGRIDYLARGAAA